MEESTDGDNEDLVPVNPIEEKDQKIANLEKRVESLKASETEIAKLKEELSQSRKELNIEKNLTFAKNATEKRLLDSINNPEGFHADPVLIGVYSATLDEEEF